MTIVKLIGKILAYLVGGLVGLVVIILVSVNFLLQSSSFTGFVLDKVLPGVEESLGADLGVEKLTLSLFPVRLRLKGVYLTPAKGEYKRRFAELGSLELDTEFLPLLSGKVVVDRLHIDNVTNYLYFGPDGLANLPFPPGEEEPEEEEKEDEGPPEIKLPIVVKDLRLTNVGFFMDMESDPEKPGPETEIAVPAINLTANADLNVGDTHAELRVGESNFRAGELADTLTRLDLDADFSLARWGGEVTKLEIRLPDVELDAQAKATDVMTELAVAADLEARINLEKVNKLFVPEPLLAGTMTLKAHADAPLPDYAVDGEITMPDGAVNKLALNDFRLAFAATQDKATVRQLFVRLAGGDIDLRADLGLKDEMPLDATVQFTSLDIRKAMEGYGLTGIGAAGVVNGNVAANGRLGNDEKPMKIAAQTDLALTAVAYQDIVRIAKVGVNVDAMYTPEAVKLDYAGITTAHTKIEADGTLGLAKSTMQFSYLVDAKDLSEFSPVAGKKVAGSVRVEGTAKGSTASPDVAATLAVKDVKFDEMGVDEITGKIAMAGKKLRVEKLVVRNDAALLTADADVNLAGKTPDIDAEVRIPKAPIGDFLKIAGMTDLDVRADLQLDAKVNGPADNLSGGAQLKIGDIAAYGEQVKFVNLDAGFADGKVLLKDLSIVKLAPPRPDYTQRADKIAQLPKDQWEEVRIHATGSFDPATGEVALDLTTEGLNEQSSDTLRKQKVPLIADIKLDMDASGTIKDPKADVRLAVTGARFGDMVLGDNVITVALADQKAHVTGALLDNREKIAIVAPPSANEGEWNIRRFNSRAEPVPATVPEEGAPEDFTQTAGEDAAGDTGPKDPLGAIRLDVTAALDGDKRLSGEILFDKFDYSPFLSSLKKEKRRIGGNSPTDKNTDEEREDIVEGRIDGNVALDGSLAAPDQVRADLRFEELYFRKNALILRNQDASGAVRPLALRYQGGRLGVESFRLAGKTVLLTIEERGGELAVTVRVDMAAAQEFAPMLTEAKGELVVTASLPTDLNVDAAQARVALEKANFAIQGVPTPVENLNFVATYAGKRVKIDRLDARIGGGTLTGGGSIDLPQDDKGIMDMKVYVRLKDVKTGKDPYLELAIEKVDLIVSTIKEGENRGKLDVSGEVVVDKAVYSQTIDFVALFKQFAELGKQKQATGKETYKEQEESVFFNIALRADGDVGFNSNVAEIETRFDLVLVGSNVTPGLKGSVDVVDGWATIPPRTYEVTHATIQFYDEQRIFPSFDINAETQVKSTKIYVSIAGNPLDYKLSLTSDPPKTERDIFFMITTGVSYEEFVAGDEDVSGDEAAAAAAQQLVGSQLGKLTGGATGFDVGVDSSSGTARVRVKGEVEKDLYLTMYRGLVDQTLGAELEYDFIRYVAGIGTWSNMAGYDDVDAAGAFGAGLRIKIDFQ